MKTRRRQQTPPEEIANSACHGLGFIAIVAAYPTLLDTAVRSGHPNSPWAVSVFAATMGMLYFCSTMYHALPRNEAKRVFQKLDQTAIFLCITGSYTGLAVNSFHGTWDWAYFCVVWGLALFAIAFRAIQGFRGTHFTTFLYVTLGLLVLVGLRPFLAHAPLRALLLFAGGLVAYAVGILFFLAHHLRFRHLIWHLLAIAGSACTFLTVLWYAC